MIQSSHTCKCIDSPIDSFYSLEFSRPQKFRNNQPTEQNGRFEIHGIQLEEASKNRDVGKDIARFDDFTLEIPTLPLVSRIFIARVGEGSRQSGQGNTYRVPKSN